MVSSDSVAEPDLGIACVKHMFLVKSGQKWETSSSQD